MVSYYTAVTLITGLTLLTLCILVKENDRIPPKEKRYLYLTYVLIALAAASEWIGLHIEGHTNVPDWALRLVKCFDYILTPIAGGTLILQLGAEGTWQRALKGILSSNAVLQIISFPMGWMVVTMPDGTYVHGPLYGIYTAVFLLVIALVAARFVVYGKKFRRRNKGSLYASIGVGLGSVLLQEVSGPNVRTAYLGLAISAVLLFVHYSEFAQLAADDSISEKSRQLMTDVLTGLGSRRAYVESLERYPVGEPLPSDLVAFTVDINGLKEVNDTLGHSAGDELIAGAADCVRRTLGKKGLCFRTGGDEFVTLAQMDDSQAERMLGELEKKTAGWKGEKVSGLTVSAGYASAADKPNLTAEQLVSESDMMMYEAKAAYYQQAGKDCRRNR